MGIHWRSLTIENINLFPEKDISAIRENLMGEYAALRLCAGNGTMVAACGCRKNAEGYWVAWCWFANQIPSVVANFRIVLKLRSLLRRSWQQETYALINAMNDRGTRLAKLMGFVVIGRYEDYENPNGTFWMMRWNP